MTKSKIVLLIVVCTLSTLLGSAAARAADAPEMKVAKLIFGEQIDQTLLSTSKVTDAAVGAPSGDPAHDYAASYFDVSHNGFCNALLMTVEKASEGKTGQVDVTLATEVIDWKTTRHDYWETLKGITWEFPLGLRMVASGLLEGKPGLEHKTGQTQTAHVSKAFLQEHSADVLAAFDACALSESSRLWQDWAKRSAIEEYAKARAAFVGKSSSVSSNGAAIETQTGDAKTVAAADLTPTPGKTGTQKTVR